MALQNLRTPLIFWRVLLGVDLLYPSYLISTQTLAKTDAWLNGPGKDSHPTLRRHILEAKDSLERALRVRAIDS